jgi:hypothetical protein
VAFNPHGETEFPRRTSNREARLVKQNEQSRHVGGKPGARDEAANRKTSKTPQPAPDQKKSSVEPKNADVGDLKNDR